MIEVVETQTHALNNGDDSKFELIDAIPKLPRSYWHSEEGIKRLQFNILCATMVCVTEKIQIPSEQWSADLTTHQICSDQLKRTFKILSGKELFSDSSIEERLLKALITLDTKSLTLEELWVFNFKLFEVFLNRDQSLTGPPLRKLTDDIWREAVTNRTFALTSPKVGVPKIKTVLDYEGTNDFNEIGKILAATSEHLDLKMGIGVLDKLNNINGNS